jgi:hypothetical protein
LHPERFATASNSQRRKLKVSEVLAMISYKTITLAVSMSFALATGAATVVMAKPASDGVIIMSCPGEIKKFCTDTKHAKQTIRACLEAQNAKLSKQCKAALEQK